MLEGEPVAEASGRDLTIVGLAAALGGLRGDAGGQMDEHDGGLGLVAVLTAGPRAPGVGFPGLPEQVGDGQCGRVHLCMKCLGKHKLSECKDKDKKPTEPADKRPRRG